MFVVSILCSFHGFFSVSTSGVEDYDDATTCARLRLAPDWQTQRLAHAYLSPNQDRVPRGQLTGCSMTETPQ